MRSDGEREWNRSVERGVSRVVMFSGGLGSWATAKRVVEEHGTDDLVLLFADTKIEDEDLYRFLDDAGGDLGVQVTKVAEGRDVWEVFFDERFLGNSRVDPCSKILKRKFLRQYIDEHFDPSSTVIYLGISWEESHRFERALRYWDPWKVEAPLCDEPLLSREDVLRMASDCGLRAPRLYELGFAHNNCGGFCVKAGQAQFALLLRTMPDRYRYHEERERELRDYLGKDVSVLAETVRGRKKPITLAAFRERIEAQGTFDEMDWGGCGCFDTEEDRG